MISDRIPEEEVVENIEAIKQFDVLSKKYLFKFGYNEIVEYLKQNLHHAGRILDLGTGSASLLIEVCKAFPNCHVTGVDLSDQMLEVARIKVNKELISPANANFIKADIKALPYEDNYFDAVISYASVHHWKGIPTDYLRESMRVLKPGGILAIFDLKREEKNLKYAKLIPAKIMRTLFVSSVKASYTLAEIRKMLAVDEVFKGITVIENAMSLGIIGQKIN